MQKSVKSGLILIFVSLMLTIISLIIYYFIAENKVSKFETTNNYIFRLNQMLSLRQTVYSAFLVSDVQQLDFYQQETSNNFKLFNLYTDSVHFILSELKYLSSNSEITDLIDSLKTCNNLQQQHFDSLVKLFLKKGLKNFGLEGRMQYHVRMIDTYGKQVNKSLLRQVMVHEKNYFLTHKLYYADSLKLMITDFRTSVLQSNASDYDKKLILSHLEQYQIGFIQIVGLNNLIGFANKQGIIHFFQFQNTNDAQLVQSLVNKIIVKKGQTRINRILFFVAAFVIILVLSIGFIEYVVRAMANPIIKMQQGIDNIINSDFKSGIRVENFNTNTEIDRLATGINVMTQKLVEKNTEINNQNTELLKSFDNIRTLSVLGQQIIVNLDIEKIIQSVYVHTADLIPVSVFTVGIFNSKLKTIDFWTIQKNQQSVNAGYDKINDSSKLSSWCFVNQRDILINNFETEAENYINTKTINLKNHKQSVIYVPLTAGDEKIGVISVHSEGKDQYTSYHLDIVKNLAIYVTIAIQNANAFDQIHLQRKEILRRNEELNQQREEILSINEVLEKQKTDLVHALDNIQILSRMGQEITAKLDIESITETIHSNIGRLMDATIFGIGIYNSKLQRIEFIKAIENGVYLPFNFDMLTEKNRLSVRCFLEQREILIKDLATEYSLYFPEMPEPKAGDIPASVVYLPLKVKDVSLGVITVQSFHKNAYSIKDINILRTLAAYIAIAVDNANTFSETELQRKNIQELVEQLNSSMLEIQNSEKQLANIIDFLPDPFMVIDNSGTLTGWNKSMEKLTGVKAADIVGKNNYEYAIPFYGERRPMLIDLILKPSNEWTGKYSNIVQDGDVLIGQALVPHLGVYLWGTAGRLFDSNKNVVGAIQISRNVTSQIGEQKALEKANEMLNLQKAEIEKQNAEILEKSSEMHELIEELQTTSIIVDEYNKELEKLSIVASKTESAVMITGPDGEIEWVNDGFVRLTGFLINEYKKLKGNTIFEANAPFQNVFTDCINNKKSGVFVSIEKNANGKNYWVQTTITPIFSENNQLEKIIAIGVDITKIKEAEAEIEKQNKKITYSIQYARRIQNAILPPKKFIDRILADHFVLFKPRDIVSGDFYWVNRKYTKVIFAVADCTGHGVPGAFMSILGISFLNEIISKYSEKINLHEIKSSDILEHLRDNIIKSLHQKGKDRESKDGMDIALAIFDIDSRLLDYSGANMPLFVVPDIPKHDCVNNLNTIEYTEYSNPEGKLIFEIKPDRFPIGVYTGKELKKFKSKSVILKSNDLVYITTDGLLDQFGGDTGRKFLHQNFRNLLLQIASEPMHKQKSIIDESFDNWINNTTLHGKPFNQIDDILTMGIRF